MVRSVDTRRPTRWLPMRASIARAALSPTTAEEKACRAVPPPGDNGFATGGSGRSGPACPRLWEEASSCAERMRQSGEPPNGRIKDARGTSGTDAATPVPAA